jgi:hypothetical protein
MPFFKRKDSKDTAADSANNEISHTSNGNGNGTSATKEKVNYKARLEHKIYLVNFPGRGLDYILQRGGAGASK